MPLPIKTDSIIIIEYYYENNFKMYKIRMKYLYRVVS